MMLFILGTFYVAMAGAGLIVDLIFKPLGLQRTVRNAKVVQASVQLDYTTVLNAVFLALAAVLVYRFIRTGGLPMLRAMNMPMASPDAHAPAPGAGH